MDVILLERVEKLGKLGDVVAVRDGFARNFLLPKKKALRATKTNIAYFEEQKAHLEQLNLKHKEEAEILANRLDGISVIILRQAGESGHLYGSVSTRDVAEGLVAAGHKTIDRHHVILEEPLKILGVHKVRLKLHPEVVTTISVNIAKTEDEAKVQGERAAADVQ